MTLIEIRRERRLPAPARADTPPAWIRQGFSDTAGIAPSFVLCYCSWIAKENHDEFSISNPEQLSAAIICGLFAAYYHCNGAGNRACRAAAGRAT
jgi:hypothetical protein